MRDIKNEGFFCLLVHAGMLRVLLLSSMRCLKRKGLALSRWQEIKGAWV